MTDQTATLPALPVHGGKRLPPVEVDSYNLETKDDEGFLGDRVNKTAFHDILEDLRKPLRKGGDDPLGKQPTEKISRKALDEFLASENLEAAGVVQGAIEGFAREFASVVRRFLKLKAWRDTERIVVGGGFRARRIGELAIGRAAVILKGDKVDVDLVPIRNDPDEAGLIGCVHLVPSWMLKGHDFDPGRRYRRHQHPGRRGRSQSQTCRRPFEGRGIGDRVVASRGRQEDIPR